MRPQRAKKTVLFRGGAALDDGPRETTALGAAYLAGLATGVWSSLDDIRRQWTLDKLYEPAMEEEKRQKLVDGWHKAVRRAKDWVED